MANDILPTSPDCPEYVWTYLWFACGHRSAHRLPFTSDCDGGCDKAELEAQPCLDCWLAAHGDVDSSD